MFKRILVPLEQEVESLAIVPLVGALAQKLSAEIVVLHVLEPLGDHAPGTVYKIRAGATLRPTIDLAQAAADSFAAGGLKSTLVEVMGKPVTAILDACDRFGADLIVMIPHRREGLARWFHRSVTQRVVRAARIPVLVIQGTPVAATV